MKYGQYISNVFVTKNRHRIHNVGIKLKNIEGKIQCVGKQKCGYKTKKNVRAKVNMNNE